MSMLNIPPDPDVIEAPWDQETTNRLNWFQHHSGMHPFTCGHDSRHVLEATPDGWVCPHDDYRQTWALRQMLTIGQDYLSTLAEKNR